MVVTNAKVTKAIKSVNITKTNVDARFHRFIDRVLKAVNVEKNYLVVSTKIGTSGMDTTRFRFNQTPSETPNGVITAFTLPSLEEYTSGLLEVFLDGIQQVKDVDWEETTASTFTFINGKIPATGEKVRINYITK